MRLFSFGKLFCDLLLIQIGRAEKLMRTENEGDEKQVIDLEWPYSHALLRIHTIGGQKSVRITPPSLPTHHSSPATSPPSQSKRAAEGVIRLDVQVLLHQQLLSS